MLSRERKMAIEYGRKRHSWDGEEDVGNEAHESTDQPSQSEGSVPLCS